jgi:hypothetical protein
MDYYKLEEENILPYSLLRNCPDFIFHPWRKNCSFMNCSSQLDVHALNSSCPLVYVFYPQMFANNK